MALSPFPIILNTFFFHPSWCQLDYQIFAVQMLLGLNKIKRKFTICKTKGVIDVTLK